MFIYSTLTDTLPSLFVFLNVASTLYEKVLNDFGDILFTMTALLFCNLVSEFHGMMQLSSISNRDWDEGNKYQVSNWIIGREPFSF
jgi:hypothetical protein